MTAALITLLLAATDPCSAPVAPGVGDPREAEIYLRVGDAERTRGNLGAAREAYRAALTRAPGTARQWVTRGRLLQKKQFRTLSSSDCIDLLWSARQGAHRQLPVLRGGNCG